MKKLIHLIAYPGAGKFTVAKKLSTLTAFKLIDNHIINNVLFSATDISKSLPSHCFGYITKIYNLLFDYILELDDKQNLIFTNFLSDSDEDKLFFSNLINFTEKAGYKYIPIQLNVNENELLNRVASVERKDKMKLTNTDIAKIIYKQNQIQINHPNLIIIDTTNFNVDETTELILKKLDINKI